MAHKELDKARAMLGTLPTTPSEERCPTCGGTMPSLPLDENGRIIDEPPAPRSCPLYNLAAGDWFKLGHGTEAWLLTNGATGCTGMLMCVEPATGNVRRMAPSTSVFPIIRPY